MVNFEDTEDEPASTQNYLMKMKDERQTSDLEDGEIREDGFEDISDCSMSEIDALKKNLENEELQINLLREEALKSMGNAEDEKEVEIEEELCRLEALKSLLKNIELSEKLATSNEKNEKRRPKKKRKHDSKHQRKKSKVVTSEVPSVKDSDLHKKQRLLSPPRKRVPIQIQKDEVILSRPWYPKADLTLIPSLSIEEVEAKPVLVRQTITAPQIAKPKLTAFATLVSPSKNRVFKNVADKLPMIKSNAFRKVTKHCIRRFNSTSPMNQMNSYASRMAVDKGKYKLVNKSNYVLNKLPISKMNGFRDNMSIRSRFSVNRLKCPKISMEPKEFVIEIGDDDSDDEEVISCSSSSSTNVTSVCDITSDKAFTTEQPKQTAVNCDEMKSNSTSKSLAMNGSVAEIDFKIDRKGEICTSSVEIKRESTPDQQLSPLNARNDTALVDSKNAEPIVKIECDQEETKSSLPKIESIKAPEELVDTNGEANMSVLLEAEAYVLKIREKLVSDLDELSKTLERNDLECEKLGALSKKLCCLKSLVTKFETRIELQQSRLAANSACLNCLYNGVQTRILTCSKFEEVCFTVGRNLVGSCYQPPSKLKSVIAEKHKAINFTKCKSVADLK